MWKGPKNLFPRFGKREVKLKDLDADDRDPLKHFPNDMHKGNTGFIQPLRKYQLQK